MSVNKMKTSWYCEHLNWLVAPETWAIPKANHFYKGDFSSHLDKHKSIYSSLISATCMNLFIILLIIRSQSSWSVSSPFTP